MISRQCIFGTHRYEYDISKNRLDIEKELRLAEIQENYLRHKKEITGPFVARLVEIQGREYVLPSSGLSATIGDPDPETSRFPIDIRYGAEAWRRYWPYSDRGAGQS